MGWHVYLLECADKSLYCGVTIDPKRRLAEHNGEIPGGARYTRTRRPVRLVGAVECPDRPKACKAEWRIKRMSRQEKLKFFSQDPPVP